jgi:DNA mismatch repair ATPase MutS
LIEPDRSALSFTIAERDQAGHDALSELRDRGVNLVADALAKSNDHILGFWRLLRAELAFYLACTNLHTRLSDLGAATCLPDPQPADGRTWSTTGLYEPCLALRQGRPPVGNDVAADGTTLVMITGANQGGKSTFLRSIGLAQLMMQAGMFAPAQRLRAAVATGLFTHFKREEDASMTRGKFEEELARMRTIAERIRPDGLLLCNEPFAATNEREGAEIARELIRALTGSRVRIVFVTHLFDLADRLWQQHRDTTRFLRAERDPDGHRTFRLTPGGPEPTSYGEDLYREVFGRAVPA